MSGEPPSPASGRPAGPSSPPGARPALRVAFDARRLGGPRGGVAYTIENLLREIVRLEPSAELRLVLRPGQEAPALRPARVSAARCPYLPPSLLDLHLFRFHVPLDGWPVFHSPHNLLPRGIRTRTVVTVHDVMWLQSRDNIALHPLYQLFAGRFYEAYLPDGIRRADRVIAVSRATRDAIVGFVPEARDKVVVIPNGLDPYFEPVPAEEVARLTHALLPERCRVVLAIGGGSPHKNHFRAIQAFLRAFADRPDWRLVVVRRFEHEEPRLRELLESPEARRQVVVLPFVTREVVRALYCRARIFFFPSWVEGFGLPILEAMACRTPVLTANVSAPAEVAGDAALTVDPFDVAALADGLRRLDADESLREELIARGVERIRDFNWGDAARKTLEVYRELEARA